MNEVQLMRLSLFGSVIGIAALYVVSLNFASVPVNIGEITNSFTGNAILVKGVVSDIYLHGDGHIFFTLSDGTGSIKVVLWDDTVKQIELNHVNIRELEEGDSLKITGEAELYKGELELVPLRAQVNFI